MKKIILLIIILSASSVKLLAQTLPVGSCGIVYTYDASGNRTKREYICNNGFAAVQNVSTDNQIIATKDILKVDVLYPNPTTGLFTVKFTTALNKATVTITDISGHRILERTESGNMLNYDLSGKAAGQYIVVIKQGEQSITMKVIKQ